MLNEETRIRAANGKEWAAKRVFALALTFFRQLVELELREQMPAYEPADVRWVLTVPAIWSATAKQFMRRAAYEAGIASDAQPAQLVIALEPEAAAVYMRTLRLRDLLAGPLPLSASAASTTAASLWLSATYGDSDLLLSLEQVRSGGVPLATAAAASHLRAQSLDAEQFAVLVSRGNSTAGISGAPHSHVHLYLQYIEFIQT